MRVIAQSTASGGCPWVWALMGVFVATAPAAAQRTSPPWPREMALPAEVTPPFQRDLVAPRQLVVYGRARASWVIDNLEESCGHTVAPVNGSARRTKAADNSYLGVRNVETLDRGWMAYLDWSHQFDMRCGGGELDAPARTATVGLGRRHLGSVTWGLQAHPGSLLLDTDALASPTLREAAGLGCLDCPSLPDRASGAWTLASAAEQPWQARVQAAPKDTATGRASGWGWSLMGDTGAWFGGAGMQKLGGSTYAVPVTVGHDDGVRQLQLAFVAGRDGRSTHHTLMAGAWLTRMGLGDPRRLQVGGRLTLRKTEAQPGTRADWQVAARYRLSERTHATALLGRAHVDGQGRQDLARVGITHEFARDLRRPQWP